MNVPSHSLLLARCRRSSLAKHLRKRQLSQHSREFLQSPLRRRLENWMIKPRGTRCA